jgi:hypothetical protein
MKYAIVALLLAFSVTDADAVVYCARGVYHAGCVARPAGAAVVRPVGGAVVAPVCRGRWVFVGGVRRCVI